MWVRNVIKLGWEIVFSNFMDGKMSQALGEKLLLSLWLNINDPVKMVDSIQIIRVQIDVRFYLDLLFVLGNETNFITNYFSSPMIQMR